YQAALRPAGRCLTWSRAPAQCSRSLDRVEALAERADRTRAMAERALHLRAELGERAVKPLGHEHRVVAEAHPARRDGRDPPRADTLRGLHPSVAQHRRDRADEAGTAAGFGHVAERGEELCDPFPIARRVAGRMHAGGTVEGIDLE